MLVVIPMAMIAYDCARCIGTRITINTDWLMCGPLCLALSAHQRLLLNPAHLDGGSIPD
jgi:hypothetical protein